MSSSYCPLTELLNKNHENSYVPPQMSMTSLRKKRLQQNLVNQKKSSGYDTQVITEISVGSQVVSLNQLQGRSPFGGGGGSSSSSSAQQQPSSSAKREKQSRRALEEDKDESYYYSEKQVAPNFVDNVVMYDDNDA